MLTMNITETDDRVEEWFDVPMFFAGATPETNERPLRETEAIG